MEDDSIYNAIIIALVIGIIIVIATLIFLRPPKEYFTEIYFIDHKALPDYVYPDQEHWVLITIANHEKEDMTYPVVLKAIMGNETLNLGSIDITVKKDNLSEKALRYTLPEFERAQIQVALPTKNQEIHFWVGNRAHIMQYPDTLANMSCLKAYNITPEQSFIITARGTANPNMSVRLNGTEVFDTIVANADYQNYTIEHSPSDILEIVFNNDAKTEAGDVNLYIKEIIIGNQSIPPAAGVFDAGSGIKAFDCQQMANGTASLTRNASLRFRFTLGSSTDFPPPPPPPTRIAQLAYTGVRNSTSIWGMNESVFDQEMAYLSVNNFTSMTFKDYYRYRKLDAALPEKPVVIVFDTGDISAYTTAKPILDKYGFVAVAAVVTEQIGARNKLNITQLNELKAAGWEIASNSKSYPRMTNSSACNDTCVQQEFGESRESLYLNLSGYETTTFIFPADAQNLTLRAECLQYYSGCSGGVSYPGSKQAVYMYLDDDMTTQGLRRIRIDNRMSLQEFTGVVG
jgi:peptidoglycan/xylan/chitin deacetylase (PgdA/CDA1 family)